MSNGHAYSDEQIEFLRLNCKLSRKDLTILFNDEFGLNLTESSVKGTCQRNGIRTGRHGQFTKGQQSWNAGKTGYMGANITSFKKGLIPKNHKPVGYERINADGFIEVKTQEPNVFELKGRLVWRENFGDIPEGMIVKFIDADPLNCSPANLILMSRAELLMLNRFYKHTESDESIKPVLIAAAKLRGKLHERIAK